MVTPQEQSQLSVLAKRLGLDRGGKNDEKEKEVEKKEGKKEEEGKEGKAEENEEKGMKVGNEVIEQEGKGEEVEEDGVCVMLRWLVWLQNVNTPSGRDDLMALVHRADNNDKGLAQDKGSDMGTDKDKGSGQGLLGVNDLLQLVWATHGRSLQLETAVEVPTPLLKVSRLH